MTRTFEERIVAELDPLYQGALFLAGGVSKEAERALVAAARSAFQQDWERDPEAEFAHRLEGCLAQVVLEEAAPVGVSSPRKLGRDRVRSLSEFDARRLHRAAKGLPVAARAALWLVLLRRWSYADASALLRVSETELRALLEHRTRLVDSLSPRSGSEPDREHPPSAGVSGLEGGR